MQAQERVAALTLTLTLALALALTLALTLTLTCCQREPLGLSAVARPLLESQLVGEEACEVALHRALLMHRDALVEHRKADPRHCAQV